MHIDAGCMYVCIECMCDMNVGVETSRHNVPAYSGIGVLAPISSLAGKEYYPI
jgi:hypothetical protein